MTVLASTNSRDLHLYTKSCVWVAIALQLGVSAENKQAHITSQNAAVHL